jgi:hypothetical protein
MVVIAVARHINPIVVTREFIGELVEEVADNPNTGAPPIADPVPPEEEFDEELEVDVGVEVGVGADE